MRELMLRLTWLFLLVLMIVVMPAVWLVTVFAEWSKRTADALDIELQLARAARKTAQERRQRGGK